jgi:hypothetical protein
MILSELETLLFTPSVSGGALLLNVSDDGSLPTDVSVGNPETVQDNIDEESSITTVRVKVFDNGGYLMFVTPTSPAGAQWTRVENVSPKYSTAEISVPTTVNTNNVVTVSIKAYAAVGVPPTATRSQTIIVRRHGGH